MSENYYTIIGLEIHSELLTNSKIFCGCSTKYGESPNFQCCPVCMGMPGALPVLNSKVVELAVRAGLAMNCNIANKSKMDRKNYFYPDLPKAYQITQYDMPLCSDGYIEIENEKQESKKIRIQRIHIEEDAGKLIHTNEDVSLIDYNRAGVPLIEIVTKPDIESSEEAYNFLTSLKSILKYLNVSNCKMEQGSLRCDVNINVVSKDKRLISNITEIKNLNSFKAVKKAIEYERNRHIQLLENGNNTDKETRGWDENNKKTFIQRKKENIEDYKYFSEPNIPIINLEDEYIKDIKASLPELPSDRKKRFIEEYKLPVYDVGLLIEEKDVADFFENVMQNFTEPKLVSNWIMTELNRLLNENNKEIKDLLFVPLNLAEFLRYIKDGVISNNIGKKVLKYMFETGKNPKDIIKEKGFIQLSDENKIKEFVVKVLDNNTQSIVDYKNGKDKALGYLIGQVMKLSKGKANPQIVNNIMKNELRKYM